MEYDSFRALGYCHEQVKHRPNYVKAAQDDKILTFSELYPSGDDDAPVIIKNEEKLFWRTRHRLSFQFVRSLRFEILLIFTKNVDDLTTWRPLVLSLPELYSIIDEKRLGDGKPGETKKNKKGGGLDQTKLDSMTAQWLTARLKITDGAKPLPQWFQPLMLHSRGESMEGAAVGERSSNDDTEETGTPKPALAAEDAKDATNAAAAEETGDGLKIDEKDNVEEEVQVYIEKLSHDTWTALEVKPPMEMDLLAKNDWIVRRQAILEEQAVARADSETAASALTSSAELGRDGGSTVCGSDLTSNASDLEPCQDPKTKNSAQATATTTTHPIDADGSKHPTQVSVTSTEANMASSYATSEESIPKKSNRYRRDEPQTKPKGSKSRTAKVHPASQQSKTTQKR